MHERLFKWTCDRCGVVAFKPDYGLPDGWISLPRTIRRDSIEQYCFGCHQQINVKSIDSQKGEDN